MEMTEGSGVKTIINRKEWGQNINKLKVWLTDDVDELTRQVNADLAVDVWLVNADVAWWRGRVNTVMAEDVVADVDGLTRQVNADVDGQRWRGSHVDCWLGWRRVGEAERWDGLFGRRVREREISFWVDFNVVWIVFSRRRG